MSSCDDPECQGWMVEAETGEIQRCDDCRVFEFEEDAVAAYRVANPDALVVERDGRSYLAHRVWSAEERQYVALREWLVLAATPEDARRAYAFGELLAQLDALHRSGGFLLACERLWSVEGFTLLDLRAKLAAVRLRPRIPPPGTVFCSGCGRHMCASAPGYLGALSGQPRAFLSETCGGELVLPCHMAVDWELTGSDLELAAEEAPKCAGQLRHLANRCKMPRDRRLAALVRAAGTDPSVFASESEFIEHHAAVAAREE